ncbi:MAG: LytTR family DNA-binding domain-containing protein [Bacteroidota bacterium]
MIKALIIDDEATARQAVRNLLKLFCPQVEVVGEAEGVQQGMALLKSTESDVAFLDIKMTDGSGFDLLDALPSLNTNIVFTTAYDQFALKAFDYHAMNYLLKPIAPAKLQAVIDKLSESSDRTQHSLQHFAELITDFQNQKLEKITLSTSEGYFILPLDQIIRLESSGSYTTFHSLRGEQIVIAKTIKEYEDLLPPNLFYRIHRSHIVHLHHVKGIMKEEGGYLLTVDDARLPISRRKKDKLIQYFKDNSL